MEKKKSMAHKAILPALLLGASINAHALDASVTFDGWTRHIFYSEREIFPFPMVNLLDVTRDALRLGDEAPEPLNPVRLAKANAGLELLEAFSVIRQERYQEHTLLAKPRLRLFSQVGGPVSVRLTLKERAITEAGASTTILIPPPLLTAVRAYAEVKVTQRDPGYLGGTTLSHGVVEAISIIADDGEGHGDATHETSRNHVARSFLFPIPETNPFYEAWGYSATTSSRELPMAFAEGVIQCTINGTTDSTGNATASHEIINTAALSATTPLLPTTTASPGLFGNREFSVKISNSAGQTVRDYSFTNSYDENLVFDAPNLTPGNYFVTLEAHGMLRRISPVTVTSQGAVTGTILPLHFGDTDRNNSVDIFDYIELSESFDLTEDDWAFFTPDATGVAPYHSDFDDDGAITVFDFIIQSASFDQVGD